MKIIRLGNSIFCKIQYENGALSISGVDGPLKSGNARGACGQILHDIDPEEIIYAPGWNKELLIRFLEIWDRWHLNDLRAGTPKQLEILKKNESKFIECEKCYYSWASELLKSEGLQIDDGYIYGSGWLTEEVPQEVIDFLFSLPDTDRKPAWV